MKLKKRDLGFVILLNVVTLCLYGLYWVASLGESVNTVIARAKYNFWLVLITSVLTLGIGACVWEIVMAYDLQRNEQYRASRAFRRNLGGMVLGLNIAAVVIALVSGGLAAVVSIALGIWATWLIQDGINALADERELDLSSTKARSG